MKKVIEYICLNIVLLLIMFLVYVYISDIIWAFIIGYGMGILVVNITKKGN